MIDRGGVPAFIGRATEQASAQLREAGLCHRLMLDCSHGNSNKDPQRQPEVAEDVAAQVADGSASICGVMLESHLLGGRQDHVAGRPLTYGQSITDACISWEDTAPVLERLAQAARERRKSAR